MSKLFLLFSLFISTPAFADDWSKADTQREVAYQMFLGVDWAQTRYVARNPDKFIERNPILGDHPSVDKVDAHFVLSGLAHYGISRALDEKWRKRFQYVTVAFQGAVVARSVHIGVGIRF